MSDVISKNYFYAERKKGLKTLIMLMLYLVISVSTTDCMVAYGNERVVSDDCNPEYTGESTIIKDIGFTDDFRYHFPDGSLDVPLTDAIMMINGTFTSKAVSIIKNECYYVPIRPIAEAYGADISWARILKL